MAEIVMKNIVRSVGRREILKDVSLTVNDGECLAIVGPSGAGKTTLLRAVSGLDPVDSGTVMIGAKDCTNLPAYQRGVSMIFQNAALFPHTKVRDNILYGIHGKCSEDQLQETARLMSVSHLLERYPEGLSAGEKQRVGIARALVRRPLVLLLDEPFSSLDARLKEQMRTEMMAIHKQLGMTMISVTHDQSEAMAMGDRIAVMKDGKIIACDIPKKLYDDPDDIETASFFGVPQINLFDCGDETIGIRPECLKEGGSEQGYVQSCTEDGYRYFVTLLWKTETLMMISEREYEPGQIISFGWDKEKEMIFDKTGGKRKRI